LNNSSNSHLVVIPTYNEIDNIEDFVNQIIKINVDILIVDDNSPDGTGDLVQKLSENLSQVNLLKRSGKLGLGSAYRDGFKWGLNEGYKYLIEMDADFSHSFSDLNNILQNSKNFDVVIGSRYIPGGGSNGWDFKRKLLSSYANKLSKVLLRSKINDMTSGFRSYSSEALNEINYFSTKSDGYSFQIEMTIRSIEKKLSIKEVPIIFTERSLGNSKMSKKIVYEAFLFLLNNGVKRWLNIKIT
jgi:dolichol-phosphate mannosyltransferase|tara:strand:- start:2236 stop:2964 length:729 start_codon:yes stop_codon:yes gene_type:complete